MIELLPMVGENGNLETIEQAFINGDINQRMSTKKIRDAVKTLTAIETTATETQETKEETKSTNETQPSPKEYTTNLCDSIEDCVNKIVAMSNDIELSEIDINKLSNIINTITEIKATINR